MATFFGKAASLGIDKMLPQMQPQPIDQAVNGMEAAAKPQQTVTVEDVRSAMSTLRKYKDAKAALESRLKEDELWWRGLHWDAIRRKKFNPDVPEPSSAWLFNAITNKHADAMDNYPQPNVLPRERGDEQSARSLSSILPCVLEVADFEETYDDAWWAKLKHGTAAYFVGWDNTKENGLGDVDIHEIDLLNVYWEPGINDIQDSRNLFITSLWDTEDLEAAYPQFAKGTFQPAQPGDSFAYYHDDHVDYTKKSLVIDWYYHVQSPDGRKLLQYVKFSSDNIMFASEDYTAPDGSRPYADRGYYDHGKYPVEFDVLFPEVGTPGGFGMIAICKNPQLYIDKISANILEHSLMGTKVRYIASSGCGINMDQLRDLNCAIVESQLPNLDESNLREIKVPELETNYINVLQMKIDEMKETSANRDFSNGSTASGVTAASAIAALQEAGNKVSRDMIKASYRSYRRICEMVIELIRQFYTETRTFRITGTNGQTEFVDFNNAQMQDQKVPLADGSVYLRRPVYDLKIKPQKSSPFTVEAQYERAKELYGLGFFNPENAQQSLIALEMMDFEGKEKIVQQVQQGQTLYNIVQQLMQRLAILEGGMMAAQGGSQQQSAGEDGRSISQSRQNAVQSNNKGYAEQLAERSRVNGND